MHEGGKKTQKKKVAGREREEAGSKKPEGGRN